jgi:MFS superfamily sulfate permease-like transporter
VGCTPEAVAAAAPVATAINVFVCMSVPVVLGIAAQILLSCVLLVVRMLSVCNI